MQTKPINGAPGLREGAWPWTLVMVVLVAAAFMNATLFAVQAANPLIASDNWHFVDVLLGKAQLGDLDAGDLFYKRGPLDHSQPLRKLILLFHYRFFDLDFSIETLIAMGAAAVNLGLFWWIARRAPVDGTKGAAARALLFAALAAVYLSLNSSMVFSWPSLTLNFTSHLFLLLFVIAFWLSFERPSVARYLLLFLAGLTAALVADDTTMIAVTAGVAATLLYAWRLGRLRHGVLGAVAALVAFACYTLVYAAIAEAAGSGKGGMALGERLHGLMAQLPEAWKWVSIPLTSSVVQRSQLLQTFGSAHEAVGTGIALALLLAHAWFWWRAVRGRINMASFAATTLMLLFYGLVFGMVLARATTFGSDYLWQPRYALIYQWNLVALLLMAIGQTSISAPAIGPGAAMSVPARSPFRAPAIAAGAAILLLSIQVPLSMASWDSLPHLANYRKKMALQMGELAGDPANPPKSCAPLLVVCKFKEDRRQRLMDLLERERLNLFSPAFQQRHDLHPTEPAEAR